MSVPILYFAYAYTDSFWFFYITTTAVIGFIIGLEIPFLTRIMQKYNLLRFNIANILSFDYLGALIATISFPFLLLPTLGVYQSSLVFGLANMTIVFILLKFFRKNIVKKYSKLMLATLIATISILTMIFFSNELLDHWDNSLYKHRIVYSKQTKYQNIIMTKNKNDIRLYLDGNLQFSLLMSIDTMNHWSMSLYR